MGIKVLGINASPRKYGNTAKLLEIALKAAKYEGADVERVDLYDYRIEPCIGCLCDDERCCRYPCVIDDDMRILLDKVLSSDALIIATPIYWYGPSGVLKNFIDRLTCLEHMIFIEGKCWAEGKVAGFIAVGNDTGAIQVIAYMMSVLNSFGIAIPPWALAYYTKSGDVLSDERALLDAANVGRTVVLTARALKSLDVKQWYVTDYRSMLPNWCSEIQQLTEKLRESEWSKRKDLVTKLLPRQHDLS
ncbi:MAG: flavodoxin family protein [Thermoprotei archaeon]|nr:MAG: flavodoxin family protein [Thermoprotei archaeon]